MSFMFSIFRLFYGPPLWNVCDTRMQKSEGIEPEWEPAAQPSRSARQLVRGWIERAGQIVGQVAPGIHVVGTCSRGWHSAREALMYPVRGGEQPVVFAIAADQLQTNRQAMTAGGKWQMDTWQAQQRPTAAK